MDLARSFGLNSFPRIISGENSYVCNIRIYGAPKGVLYIRITEI